MPDLMTTLSNLSNQISQIVDRVAGIELRVSAMEQPVRKVSNTWHSPSSTEEQTKIAFEEVNFLVLLFIHLIQAVFYSKSQKCYIHA